MTEKEKLKIWHGQIGEPSLLEWLISKIFRK